MTNKLEKQFFDTFGIEPDVQTINITIDDLINGNLRDMEFTAQFAVYRQAVKGLAEQLKRKEQECEELKLDLIEAKAHGDYLNNLALSKTLETVSAELDQFKAEQNKIKTICDNHFDEYEMGCLDLSDAIESLLERYDNAITGLMKQRKELKAENEELKNFHINLVGVKECEIKELVKLKQTLTEIKQLLEDALDTDKTDTEQSFDNIHKAIKLCEVLKQ